MPENKNKLNQQQQPQVGRIQLYVTAAVAISAQAMEIKLHACAD
jgi:hypothetical protein